MRVKSHWFKGEAAHSAEQQAGAMAFITWRAARNMLQRMRQAGFDIDAGPAYFAFLREVSIFLVAVIDRIAHARLDDASRQAFTSTLVRHCADTYADNALDLLGPPAGDASYRDEFIDAANELMVHYADFGADTRPDAPEDGFTPDFGFVRYLGSRLQATVAAKDRDWVVEQVMAAEAPDGVRIVQHAMRDLWSTAPRRPRRGALSGD